MKHVKKLLALALALALVLGCAVVALAYPVISISPSSLPNGTVGIEYSFQLDASGGTSGYSYTLNAGELPQGLTFGRDGLFSGAPEVPGIFPFTIIVADNNGLTASQDFTLKINAAPIVITTAELPNGTAGTAYNATLEATGGTPPHTWALTAGALPPDLTLTSDGTLSGIPVALGTYHSTLKVTDSTGTAATRQYTISIGSSLEITTTQLDSGTTGTAYNATLEATGGIPPYTWAVTAGVLPFGLTLTSDGALSGTPEMETPSHETSFTVTDGTGAYVTKALTFVITAPAPSAVPAIVASLPNGTVGASYTASLAASNADVVTSWNITSGSLPTGLSLGDGVIEGTPTTVGIFPFTITATHAGGTVNKDFTVVIAAAGGEGPNIPPTLGSGSSTTPSPTDNASNSSETIAKLNNTAATLKDSTKELPKGVVLAQAPGSSAPVHVVPVTLYNGTAALSVGTVNSIGALPTSVGLQCSVDGGSAVVTLTGSYGKVSEAGRLYYPLDFAAKAPDADNMLGSVKPEGAKSETFKLGANFTLPKAAGVSVKTALPSGERVNIYVFDAESGKYTLVASTTVKDGRLSFATARFGQFLVTTGKL